MDKSMFIFLFGQCDKQKYKKYKQKKIKIKTYITPSCRALRQRAPPAVLACNSKQRMHKLHCKAKYCK